MKTRIFLATAIVAFGITSVFGQTMKINLSSGSEMEFKTSEVTSIEFKEGDIYNGHEYVDLGLPSGLKWATCNVGASNPVEYGDFFSWGETDCKGNFEKYSNYSLTNYKYYKRTETKEIDKDGFEVTVIKSGYTKYVTDSGYGYESYTDNKTILDLEDDAAHVIWGGGWRIPTRSEWEELENECSWIDATLNGVSGKKVSGPNGNFLFIPYAGECDDTFGVFVKRNSISYWCSDISLSYNSHAYCSYGTRWRYYGMNIRAVCP